jgi:hypothetical protein|tara:strand:+ start:147 stop:320 length:174 start_codon:yes stop_codon:yes gene_type:complete
MEDSKIRIEIIGAISELPGVTNQIDPKMLKIKGIQKKVKYLFLTNFENKKQIEIKTK